MTSIPAPESLQMQQQMQSKHYENSTKNAPAVCVRLTAKRCSWPDTAGRPVTAKQRSRKRKMVDGGRSQGGLAREKESRWLFCVRKAAGQSAGRSVCILYCIALYCIVLHCIVLYCFALPSEPKQTERMLCRYHRRSPPRSMDLLVRTIQPIATSLHSALKTWLSAAILNKGAGYLHGSLSDDKAIHVLAAQGTAVILVLCSWMAVKLAKYLWEIGVSPYVVSASLPKVAVPQPPKEISALDTSGSEKVGVKRVIRL